MQNSSLVVQVFTSAAKIPVENAQVYIATADDSRLLAVEQTDEIGRTVPIVLEVPDDDLTLEPNNGKGWMDVNVYVAKDGFFNVLIRGVQLFGGVESVQSVQLLPLPLNYTGSNVGIIDITPQDL